MSMNSMKKLFLLILTTIVFSVASSCEKNQERDFPLVSFDEYIYLNNPSNIALQNPGGAIYHTGGYRGLIIYRRFINGGNDDFGAFDRACPEHYRENCSQLEIEDDGIFASCPCGGEKYLLFDGAPGDSATTSMVEYQSTFDGAVIRVRN